MALDFRFAVDWQDNGHINWLQDATAESDPLNTLTSASLSSYTLVNATLGNVVTNYGLNRAVASAPGTSPMNIAVSSGIGQISVSSNTQYTVGVWIRKSNPADNAKNLRILVRETTSGSSTVLQSTNSTYRAEIAQSTLHYLDYVTFTTTGTTEKIYITIDSNSGAFTGTYVAAGVMLILGSGVPTAFNDGAIKVLTHRVIKADWNVGYKTSIIRGSVADENRLECVLYNKDDYITETKYADAHRVYIEASDDSGATWSRVYTGWTNKWFLSFDSNGDGRIRFQGVSSRFYLDGINARLAVQESKTMKQIAQAIIDKAELPNGETLTVAGITGDTFNYAGHTWTEEVDLLRALADTVGGGSDASGFLYFDRDDTPTIIDLLDFVSAGSIVANISSGDIKAGSVDYRYADPWVNMVEVKYSPRKLSSTSDKQLWRLPEDYDITAGSVQNLLVRFNDEDKPYQIGARNLSYDNFTGSPGTSNVTVTITARSTSADIEFDATARVSDTTITDFRLIGQKIKSWDSVFVQRYYSSEVTTNGNNTLTLHYDITDAERSAQTMGQRFLDLYGEKIHRVWSFVIPQGKNDSLMLDMEPETIYGIDGDKYVCIGEAWTFKGGRFYEKRVYVERAYASAIADSRPSV